MYVCQCEHALCCIIHFHTSFLFSIYISVCIVYFVHCGFHVRNNTLPDSHAPLWHSGVHNWRRGGDLLYGPTWELCKMAEPEPPAAAPHSASSQPVLGSLGEFDYRTDSVLSYLKRMQLYFEANAVADDRKVAVLLTVIGAKTYETLRSLLAPERPRDKSLKAILLKHYDSQPLVIGEHFRFYRRSQKSGESHRRFRRRPAATQHKVRVW